MDVAGCTRKHKWCNDTSAVVRKPRALRPILGGDLQGQQGSAGAAGCWWRLKAMVSEEFQKKLQQWKMKGWKGRWMDNRRPEVEGFGLPSAGAERSWADLRGGGAECGSPSSELWSLLWLFLPHLISQLPLEFVLL